LRGFGLSDRPNGVLNYTIDQQLEDMAETIQMLKAQPGKSFMGNKIKKIL